MNSCTRTHSSEHGPVDSRIHKDRTASPDGRSNNPQAFTMVHDEGGTGGRGPGGRCGSEHLVDSDRDPGGPPARQGESEGHASGAKGTGDDEARIADFGGSGPGYPGSHQQGNPHEADPGHLDGRGPSVGTGAISSGRHHRGYRQWAIQETESNDNSWRN